MTPVSIELSNFTLNLPISGPRDPSRKLGNAISHHSVLFSTLGMQIRLFSSLICPAYQNAQVYKSAKNHDSFFRNDILTTIFSSKTVVIFEFSGKHQYEWTQLGQNPAGGSKVVAYSLKKCWQTASKKIKFSGDPKIYIYRDPGSPVPSRATPGGSVVAKVYLGPSSGLYIYIYIY